MSYIDALLDELRSQHANAVDTFSDPEMWARKGREAKEIVSSPRKAWDTATNVAGRGLAAVAGAPVDTTTLLLKALRAGKGLAKHAVTGRAEDLEDLDMPEQTGGSEWIGRKLTDAGLMTGERNPVLETLSGFAVPSLVKGGIRVAEALPGAIEAAKTGLGNAGVATTIAMKNLGPIAGETWKAKARPARIRVIDEEGNVPDKPADIDPSQGTYWHGIGSGAAGPKKLEVPLENMDAVRVKHGEHAPKEIVDLAKLKGSHVMAGVGDLSAGDEYLLSLGGEDLARPVHVRGGHDYMTGEGGWASERSKIDPMADAIRRLSPEGDVYMMHSTMAPGANDHNTFMMEALLQQLRAREINPRHIEAMDKWVRQKYPDFLGSMTDEGQRQLMEGSGMLRKRLYGYMESDAGRKAGMPNVAMARYAVTDPNLLDVPTGMVGSGVTRMNPSGRVLMPEDLKAMGRADLIHPTYEARLEGTPTGRLPQLVPRQLIFRDWYNARREAGQPESGDDWSFMIGNPKVQRVDQQMIDEVLNYLRQQQRQP